MLLAMKIKAAITAAALASPIALTIAPVASVGSHHVNSEITKSLQSRSSIGSQAISPVTASLRKPRCATRVCPRASGS